jgi:hypothetical protein
LVYEYYVSLPHPSPPPPSFVLLPLPTYPLESFLSPPSIITKTTPAASWPCAFSPDILATKQRNKRIHRPRFCFWCLILGYEFIQSTHRSCPTRSCFLFTRAGRQSRTASSSISIFGFPASKLPTVHTNLAFFSLLPPFVETWSPTALGCQFSIQ